MPAPHIFTAAARIRRSGRHQGWPILPGGAGLQRQAGGQDRAQVRQPSWRRTPWREPQAQGGEAGAGRPAPRQPRAALAGCSAYPAARQRATMLRSRSGCTSRQAARRSYGAPYISPHKISPSMSRPLTRTVPASDRRGSGAVAAAGWLAMAWCMTGPPLSPVRPVCGCAPDGVLDGTVDCLVAGGCFKAGWRGRGGRVFAQGGGEAAEGTAAAQGGGLAFQAADGGHRSCREPAGLMCPLAGGSPSSMGAIAASKRPRSLESTIHGLTPSLPRA